MKQTLIYLFTFLLLIPVLSSGQKKLPTSEEKDLMAAKQVLMRVIGIKAEAFIFEKIPSDKGLDVYEVIALGGKVLVKGSSTIAMTRGAYDYLRTACNIQYTWSTDQVTPPASLPDLTIPRTVTPYKYRQYYNVCTYGYSTAFWKWEDWQREIDWMALHGINMPLAMAGQEAIWQSVYKGMGMTDEDLSSFFTGPAFLPWQRMGNVNKHGGPLPQAYIDAARDLQKQLLGRMQQLGMEPIVPAFSGFVPGAYKKVYPKSKLLEVKVWCDFPEANKSYILSPGSPDFVSTGKSFIEEYQKTYGKVHFYLADLFNENDPPVSSENRLTELADFGKSVFDAINAGDPEGTWIMQGWLFYNQQNFWNKESVKAFLSKVPDDRMIIIDLANEEFHGWQKLDGFYGKPWIYSTIHNYGGNSQLVGNLPLYAADAPAMLANPAHGNVVGFGLSPEGIDNNEVVYELLTDMAWTRKPIDAKQWIQKYFTQRYGATDNKLLEPWLSLMESVYSSPTVHPLNIYQCRPSLSPSANIADNGSFNFAVECFLNSADQYLSNAHYKHDLVQLVVQFAGNKVDLLLKRAILLHQQGNDAQSQEVFARAKELMIQMDGLIYNLHDQRLESKIDEARKWGKTKEESDYYEANAKRQVTMWGNSGTPVLFEYASKVWSGLIRDYYMQRWMLFAESLRTGKPADFDSWEEKWISTPGLQSKAPITGDLLAYARKLYNAAGQYALTNSEQVAMTAKFAGNNQAEVSFRLLADSPDAVFTALVPAEVKKGQTAPEVKQNYNKVKIPSQSSDSSARVYYSTDGSAPNMASRRGETTALVTLPATVKASAFFKNAVFGDVSSLYLPVSFGKPVVLNPTPSPKYMANGYNSVNDAVYGSADFKAGNWLGYEGESVTASIDLEAAFKIKKVSLSYLENANAWIFGPAAIIVQVSADGITYTPVATRDFDDRVYSSSASLMKCDLTFPETSAKFVRVTLMNRGKGPEGTASAGHKAWMFFDEISVE